MFFPNIDIPVASVIWAYSGASPNDMEKRIVTIAERSYTTSVNDIEHIESQSMPGVSVIKLFFQPGAKVEAAVAQLTATSQTLLKTLPPGITPPLIIQYSASSVPIMQLGVSSKTHVEVADLRLCAELRPYAACDRARRVHALALWRQAAPDHGGSGSAGAAGEGTDRL